MRRVIFVALLIALAGCTPTTHETQYAEVGDYTAAQEVAWQRVVACYAAKGFSNPNIRRPQISIRESCLWSDRYKVFYWEYEPGLFCTGYYHIPDTVELCRDEAALIHEMSHHVSLHTRGTSGWNVDRDHPRELCYGVAWE